MLKLSEQNLIKEIIKKKDISCLCHFTPRKNLESIRKNGLVCRNQLPYNAQTTDNSRWDTHSNSICLSISKPNASMLSKKAREGLDLVLIILSPEILYEKNCLFFPHNAATKCYRYSPTYEFQGSEALEKLFANKVSYTKANGKTVNLSRYRKNLTSYEATSDQAEVQCLENIEAKYIIKVFEEGIPLTARGIKINTKEKEITNNFSEVKLTNDFSEIKFSIALDMNKNKSLSKNNEKIDDDNKHKNSFSLARLFNYLSKKFFK